MCTPTPLTSAIYPLGSRTLSPRVVGCAGRCIIHLAYPSPILAYIRPYTHTRTALRLAPCILPTRTHVRVGRKRQDEADHDHVLRCAWRQPTTLGDKVHALARS